LGIFLIYHFIPRKFQESIGQKYVEYFLLTSGPFFQIKS
jgi:hypothetical protein